MNFARLTVTFTLVISILSYMDISNIKHYNTLKKNLLCLFLSFPFLLIWIRCFFCNRFRVNVLIKYVILTYSVYLVIFLGIFNSVITTLFGNLPSISWWHILHCSIIPCWIVSYKTTSFWVWGRFFLFIFL